MQARHQAVGTQVETETDQRWSWLERLVDALDNDESSNEDPERQDTADNLDGTDDFPFAQQAARNLIVTLSEQHVFSKFNPHLQTFAANTYQPRYDLFCCWKTHLS